jgi:hypothetical protein
VDLSLDGIEGNRVVRCVWGEDRDCGTWGESVDGCFIGFGVAFVIWRVGVEGGVEAIVDLGNVFVEMFALSEGKLGFCF